MNERTCFLVPTTSRNRDWESIEDSYLYKILCSNLKLANDGANNYFYVGFDTTDKIFSKDSEQEKLTLAFPNFHFTWVPFAPQPGNVVRIWNELARLAIERGFNYLMILGDDILPPKDKYWLTSFIKALQKQDNIGWAAGYSNNDDIATQFLVHSTHWDIFGFIFPPQIRNWYCDNWMNEIYAKEYKYWNQNFKLSNCGGEPRYQPLNDKNLCTLLVKRYKKNLKIYLQN